jgi:hypothetical protein
MSSVTAHGSWLRRPPSSPTMISSLGPATCGRSGRRPQLHVGYPSRNVHARLRLHGHRLQGDRAVRASDQDVGTNSGADRAAGGRTHIGSRQRRPAQCGRRKNGPGQLTAGRGADVEAKRADGALISLARPASRRCIDAAQLPLSPDNEADPGRYVAGERADPRSPGFLSRGRNHGEGERRGGACGCETVQRCFVHGRPSIDAF